MGETSNYYSADIIEEEDGQFKILDVHGFSDAISFTEKAGYHPRTERIDRFISVLKKKSEGKDIVLIMDPLWLNSQDIDLPPEAESFYSMLPQGFALRSWHDRLKDFFKVNREREGNTTLLIKELDFLSESARKQKVDLHIASVYAYDDTYLSVQKWDLKTVKENFKKNISTPVPVTTIPYTDIGFLCVRSKSLLAHPGINYLWDSPMKELPFPFMNSVQLQYLTDVRMPKWSFPLILQELSEKDFSSAFPKEVYIGMGLSTSADIEAFRDSLSPQKIMAVTKPLCTHYGIDISYLTSDDLGTLIKTYRSLDKHVPSVRKKVITAMKKGFSYTKRNLTQKQFDGYYWDGKSCILPIAEYGSYILQEFITAKPVKSQKTGKLHQGNIRVQILGETLISAMHRLTYAEYDPVKFHPLTFRENKTFFERADDALEVRIMNFMQPILKEFDAISNTYSLDQWRNLHDSIVKSHYGL